MAFSAKNLALAIVVPPSIHTAPIDLDSSERFTESLKQATGIEVSISDRAVCVGHQSPWEMFRKLQKDRPPIVLVLGARGTGKSYLSALDTHLTSLKRARHGTRVLGGSRSQSEQIYRALRDFSGFWPEAGGEDPVKALLKSEAVYRNGSEVTILAASSTSVRGPHVPSLKLDEVDEIDVEHFESAMGMCMEMRGSGASIVMTSTWHRMNGPMSGLIHRARGGEFPIFSFCIFEVLERCPDERSGPNCEKCPTCPIQKYCHDVPSGVTPKAKRSSGHYSINALIQKLKMVSARTFESDYLCKGPKADGLWFPDFSTETHVSESADCDPNAPVYVAIDSGVFTGAVYFQVTRDAREPGVKDRVNVFADYLMEGGTAESNALAIKDVAMRFGHGRMDRISTDPAGGSRSPLGVTVMAEYIRAGLRPLERWPIGSVADGLSLLESFTNPADGPPRLIIHPRCESTILAMQSYRRAKRGGQWRDFPEDPQHPYEELVDSLRGGLRLHYPEGRVPQSTFPRISARQVF